MKLYAGELKTSKIDFTAHRLLQKMFLYPEGELKNQQNRKRDIFQHGSIMTANSIWPDFITALSATAD